MQNLPTPLMSNIKIQVRVRPPGANPAMKYSNDEPPQYRVDYNDELLYLRNKETESKFKFDRIYDAKSSQEDVFKGAVSEALQSFLEGYNCAVMCYGQTGSGKSYTQTGGQGSYNERGMMPRAIEQLFNYIEQHRERQFEVFISYVQILNEGGFDLLSQSGDLQQNRSIDSLQRVQLLETSENVIKVKNLSAFRAATIEEALNILWNGDLNRVVTATSQNQASSRSHCIFTLTLHSRPSGSDTVRNSKFHFVDLAGSERVSRTGADGLILKQARYINVSLFHLETVIQQLAKQQQDKSVHVPYRNSMMTLFLKDSLGGNCKTVLVATVAVESYNVAESIATCQFAMQVGSIHNDARVNEEIDVKLLVARLKLENKLLKEELKLLKFGENANAQRDLSEEDMEFVRRKAREFLDDVSIQQLEVGNYYKIMFGIRYIRELYAAKTGDATQVIIPESESQIAKLKSLLQQRDAEIDILTQMIGGDHPRERPPPSTAVHYTYDEVEEEFEDQRPDSNARELKFEDQKSISRVSSAVPVVSQSDDGSRIEVPTAKKPPKAQSSEQQLKEREQKEYLAIISSASNICKLNLDSLVLEQIKDESFVFAQFQSKYYKIDRLNADKQLLQDMYKQVKQEAAVVIELKEKAEKIKSELIALISQMGKETDESDLIKQQLNKISASYTEKLQQLKQTKIKIEGLESQLNAGKEQMKKDFVRWYRYAVQYLTKFQNKHKQEQNSNQQPHSAIDADIQSEIDAFYAAKQKAGI